jgi:zinc protease
MTIRSGTGFVFVFLILFCGHASAAQGQKPLVFPTLSSSRLLNDLQIHVASTPYLGDNMTIGLVIRSGSTRDPANKGGVAYLTSQLLGKATVDLSAKDIQDELGYLNATLEVRSDWDGIRLLLRGPSDAYERALLLLYRIACEAKFNDDDFAAAQKSLIRQLQAPEDPRQRVRNQLDVELFRGTTYGRPMRGTLASVQNIAVGDVRYFYRRYSSPDEAALVVVGSAPAQDVLQKAHRIWGVWVRADEVPFTFLPPREPAARNIFLEDDPGSPAAQYVLGNFWPSREDPGFYSGMLAARLLEERLTKALPTSRLTVAAEGRRLAGPFSIQGQAAADQTVGEINKILAVVEAFKDSEVTAAEATKAQDQWIDEFGKPTGSTDGVCNLMLDEELYRLGVNYLSTFSDFVRRCTPVMIKEAAKRWLFPGGLVLIVRGPADALRPQLESLGTVQLIKR